MSQYLRALSAITENPDFIFSTEVRQHRTACSSGSREPITFSVLFRLLNSYDILPHRHTPIKNKNTSKNEIVSYFSVKFSSGRNRHEWYTDIYG